MNKKWIVLLCLSLVIVLMATLIQVRASLDTKVDGQSEPPVVDSPSLETPYSLTRSPRISLNPSLAWETNIGGSGLDTAGAAYYLNGKIYIFGTTDSVDKDFVTGGTVSLFMCKLNSKGHIESVLVFGSNGNDTFVKARIFHNGFIILATSDQNYGDFSLYNINLDNERISTYNFSTPLREAGVDLYYDSNRPDEIVIISSLYDPHPNKTKLNITVLDRNFSALWSKNLEDESRPARSLSFCAVYPSAQGFDILTTVREGIYDYPSVFSVSSTGMSYVDISPQSNLKLLDAVPHKSGGYLLALTDLSATDQENNCSVVRFVKNEGVKASYPMTLANAEKAKLIPDDRGYFVQYSSQTESITSFITPALTVIVPSINGLKNEGYVKEYIVENSYAIFLVSKVVGGFEKIGIITMDTDFTLTTKSYFGGIFADIPVAVQSYDGSLTIIANTYSDSLDVGGNFGKSDVWVLRLNP